MAFPSSFSSSSKKGGKQQAALEKREERFHADLDHDGEKGESPAHRRKVLGSGTSKSSPLPDKGSGNKGMSSKKGKGVCGPCKKKGLTFCSH